ncbi:hypothetical protein KKC_04214 [Listeria fleischmannii subsp. coloradonensis]|jgi:hypothetical protein|uniref:Uncharacterized protein n=1 Tax=Listeria fleischmannii subsp. fleischmannii TaxID=1671902 RepID=A0A2X3H3Q3_9LIST|nr:hypothetical protein KKC_04214 [Listeria fleischmannii subsp. coloradonensis]SQC65325.1 Uncharacterised protein [Listeria fleischmannii subsp. fleischmannii]
MRKYVEKSLLLKISLFVLLRTDSLTEKGIY